MELAGLFERQGPFVSAYLVTDPAVENASQRSLSRWKNVRRDLEAAGAPTSALDAIESLVPDAHHEGATLAAIADDQGVAFTRGMPEAWSADWARYGLLPSIGPLLKWLQSSPTHFVVDCDHTGADIVVFAAEAGGPVAALTVRDDPHDPVLHKSKPGGWSQRRYQERAENAWEANAKEVVERLSRLTDLLHPRVVFVHGDVRAVQLLKEHLPDRVLSLVRELGAADDTTLSHAVATVVAEDTVAILERFKEELGQHDRAVEGVDATLTALSEARVEMLLVHDARDDTRECWFAPEKPLAATSPEPLQAQGVETPLKERMVDVAIRTAFGTSAEVRIVPNAAVAEGIGAILRF